MPVPICCADASSAVRVPSVRSRSENPSGMMRETCWPTSSSRWYPNCFSAWALSKTMFSYQIYVEAETTPDVDFLLKDAREKSEATAARLFGTVENRNRSMLS